MQKSEDFTKEANDATWYSFKNSHWWGLGNTLPWDALEACLPERHHGPQPYFDRKGKFALMLLNTSWEYRMRL